MDRTGWTASGNCRPRRVLRGPRPARARLQGSGVEGSGLRSRVLCSQRARRWGGSQARGRPECCAASAAAVFIPGRWLRPFVAGRAACSWPGPPRPSPRGFVYGLGLFSEAPAAPAPLAVAQPRAGGNLKPRCQARAPAAAPLQAPPAPAPRPPGAAAAAAGRAEPGSREAAPRPPAAAGLARCRKEAGAASGSLLGGGGEEGLPPPPQPRAVTSSPAITTALGERGGVAGGGGTARRGRTQGWGRGTTASWPQPSSGAEGAPAPTPAPVRRGGDVAPTPPAPKLSLTGPLPARVRGWQRKKDREARRHLRPAGWEWRAGTVPHPTLGTLRAQRPRPGRLAAHCAVASTFEAPGAELLFGGTSAPSSPSRGAATSGLLMSLRELPGQEFCFGSGERSDRGTQKAPSPDRRGLKEVRRAGPAPAQVPRPSQTSSLT